MSIEERVRSTKEWILRREGSLRVSKLDDMLKNELEKQREIDIEKSIKWLVEHECFGCEDSMLATSFREYMKEDDK